MKRVLLLSVSLVFLSACSSGKTPTDQPAQQQKTDQGTIESLIQSGKSIRWDIQKKDGSMKMTSLVKGEKVKTTGITSTDSTYKGAMIVTDTYLYTWDETKKTGIQTKLPDQKDVEKLAQTNEQQAPTIRDEESKKELEDQGYTVSCVEAAISDSEFTPPSDVKFTDTSAMMDAADSMLRKNSQQQGAPNQAPVTEEELQKMMDQFKTEQ